MMTPYVVTRYYRAPEVILGMGYKENGEVAPPIGEGVLKQGKPQRQRKCEVRKDKFFISK